MLSRFSFNDSLCNLYREKAPQVFRNETNKVSISNIDNSFSDQERLMEDVIGSRYLLKVHFEPDCCKTSTKSRFLDVLEMTVFIFMFALI